MKLNLGRDSEARFGQYLEVLLYLRCSCLVEILKMIPVRDSEDVIRSRFV